MSRPTYFLQLWFRWKALRLPWRRKRLVGYDLASNTYWTFKDPLQPGRQRRIMRHPGHVHHSEVKMTPAWMQWLRHTRDEPPSIREQEEDVVRQRNLKVLAARADERWEAQGRFIDRPAGEQQTGPMVVPRDKGGYGPGLGVGGEKGRAGEGMTPVAGAEDVQKAKRNPWKQADRGRAGEWQPQSWTPGQAAER